jgi:hypothetical protein
VSTTRSIRLGAVLALAALAAFLVWYFAIRDTGGGSSGRGNVVGPEAATVTTISSLAKKDDRPIYWAGKQPGTTDLELTETADGNVYVRYLTGGAPIGTPKPSYLTVGTYPFQDAFHALQVLGKRSSAVTKHLPQGGLAVTNRSSPTSVYLAYPSRHVQVEVYEPNAKRALSLVTSGAVQPVR